MAYIRSDHFKGGGSVVVDCLTSPLSQLEADGSTGFPLANIGSVERVTIWRHVVDAKRNKIAATQLAVDRKVEECQIARPALQLQPGAD